MSNRYACLYVIIGAALWAAFVFITRDYSAMIFDQGMMHNAAFAATPFAAGAVLWLAALISRVPMRLMLPPAAVMTLTALLLNALALTWVPQIYAVDSEMLRYASGWFMWILGSMQMMGFVAFKLSAPD